MDGSIFIENILFSRNCDIKTTKFEEHHRRFYFGKVYFKNSNTLEIAHSLLKVSGPCVQTFCIDKDSYIQGK